MVEQKHVDDEEFFNELAKIWDDNYEKVYFYRDRVKVLRDWLKIQNINNQIKSKVALDIGCGTGQAAKAYSTVGIDLIGIDISNDMLRAATQKDYQSVQKFDGLNIPYKDNYFDIAHMFNVIEFVENPEALLSEVFRVLKKDAHFLMTITNYNNIIEVLVKMRNRLINRPHIEHPQFKHAFTFADAKKILNSVGFKRVQKFNYSISGLITSQEYRWYYAFTRNMLLAGSIYIEAST